jgi:hypothetical protein
MTENKIIHNMPMADYHAHPNYSKTDLVRARRSPGYVRVMRDNPPDPSPAMILGTAVHLLVLEPDRAKEELVVAKAKTRRGKAWDEEAKEHEGKLILLEKEAEPAYEMEASVRSHELAVQLVSNGYAEVSAFCDLSLDDGLSDIPLVLPVKCRPDYVPEPGLITDLKTARTIDPDGFSRDGYNFKYHWSAWLSCRIMEQVTGQPQTYYFVVVENKFPYETVVYKATGETIAIAEAELDDVIGGLAASHEENEFEPIAANTVLNFDLPAWARRKALFDPSAAF